jgi:2-methylcitrate dehydratase PrpD
VLVAEPIDQKRQPRSVVDAQFSAPYAAAAALVLGTGGLDAFAPHHLDDPLIRQLMSRTDCYTSGSLDAGYPKRWPAEAEITLRDGRRLSTRIEYALGEPEHPVPPDALLEKFVSLCGLAADDAHALARRLVHIDAEPSLDFL